MRQNGFYKLDGILCHATERVVNKDYEILVVDHDHLDLPIDGWYYFEDENRARDFFELPRLVEDKEGNWVEI